MKVARGIGLGLLLSLASASADILSGTVTDADAGTPLSGVKVSVNAGTHTQSDPNGAFSLNTDPSALFRSGRPPDVLHNSAPNTLTHPSPRFLREYGAAAFFGFGAERSGKRGIHNAKGALILPIPDATAQPAPLAKAAALNALLFEKAGYAAHARQVEGSRSGLAITLRKQPAANKADLTWFESYPDPGSEECIKYNGCAWAGQFAAVSGKQPESWVMANNICAVHEKDFAKYRLKTLRLTQGTRTIDVKVYDMCADTDCDGCCTANAKSGFLIDVEKYTAERFGTRSGMVDWVCLDCGE